MANRTSTRKPRDLNRLAASIVADVTGDVPMRDAKPAKNPAAVELGRLGGRKGGKARATKLSAEKRSEIARLAALARWQKK